MNRFYLSEIYIYPIKSLGGISLGEAWMEARGLQYDRRWMLIDPEGVFITQRKHPLLSLLKVSLTETQITVQQTTTGKQISFGLDEQLQLPIAVNIWDDYCNAFEVNVAVSLWFTEVLQMPVRLVKMPEFERREVDHRYALKQEIVSFADGYPTLLIGQSSLNGLNERLAKPVLMNRFRPNLVFTGGDPHIEDSFRDFSIGEIHFSAVKPCARCVLIAVNQESAVKSAEPLKTLATYRTINKKVMFGQNLLHHGNGILRVGDELKIDTWKV